MSSRIVNRKNKSINYVLPCPTNGLNARDSRDKMAQTDALVMDNYYPFTTQVSLRRGYKKYIELPFSVKTLGVFNASAPKDSRLFAFGGKTVWDISNPRKPYDYQKKFTSNEWRICQFKNRLFAVNGLDRPQVYVPHENSLGSWEDVSWTGEGLNPCKLTGIAASKQRLWLIENKSLTVWYSEGASEVQGKLIPFDFSTVATRGGYLVAVGCWTQDGGQGIDDLTVFLTSEGEALVYAGSNPNSADDWHLKGVYQISRPIGQNALLQYHGDLVVISEAGYIPLSKALALQNATDAQIAFSDRIQELVLDRIQRYQNKYGWQGIIYPRGGYALFNVPLGKGFEQHIVNTTTGAWCRFTGIDAYTWALYQTRLFFGTKNAVMMFDEGYTDDGAPIEGHVEQAFCDFGSPYLKKVQLVNIRTKSSGYYALQTYWNTDYQNAYILNDVTFNAPKLSPWNGLKWATQAQKTKSYWATLAGKIFSQWIGCNATGFKFSLVFQTKTKGMVIHWYETGVRYEQGTGIL